MSGTGATCSAPRRLRRRQRLWRCPPSTGPGRVWRLAMRASAAACEPSAGRRVQPRRAHSARAWQGRRNLGGPGWRVPRGRGARLCLRAAALPLPGGPAWRWLTSGTAVVAVPGWGGEIQEGKGKALFGWFGVCAWLKAPARPFRLGVRTCCSCSTGLLGRVGAFWAGAAQWPRRTCFRTARGVWAPAERLCRALHPWGSGELGPERPRVARH